MSHPFYRTKLIYEISQAITKRRLDLLSDLVAYTQDAVRYNRRMRMLIQLSSYEHQILSKIKDEEISKSEIEDLLMLVNQEIDIISDLNS